MTLGAGGGKGDIRVDRSEIASAAEELLGIKVGIWMRENEFESGSFG